MALAAVLAGLLPANSGTVFIGNRLALGLPAWRPFSRALGSEAVQGALAAVRRHGRGLVFVTRFTPLVRGPVYLATGLSQMGVRRFFVADAAAACIHVPLLLWLGGRVGQGAGSIAEAWNRAGFLAGGLAAAAIAYQIVRRLGRGSVDGVQSTLGPAKRAHPPAASRRMRPPIGARGDRRPLVRDPVHLSAGLAQMSARRSFAVEAVAACVQLAAPSGAPASGAVKR